MINREPILSPLEAWELSISVMQNVFAAARPSSEYCDTGARLLMMIGAHESGGWKHPRQHNGQEYFPLDSARNAFGLWQTEPISILESLRRLEADIDIAIRSARWLFQANVEPFWYRAFAPGQYTPLHTMIVASPRASVLFARLHVMWDPKPIPSGVNEQAKYAKAVYNRNGSASSAQYIQAWYKHCEPLFRTGTFPVAP
jgi:hypothetical protein